MLETQMRIKAKSFLLCWLVLTGSCFGPLIVFFSREPTLVSNHIAAVLASVFISAIVGGAIAFVVCGVAEAVRSLRAGTLTRSEIAASVSMMLMIALVLVFESLVKVPVIGILLIVLVVWWLAGVVRRIVTRKRRRTSESTLYH